MTDDDDIDEAMRAEAMEALARASLQWNGHEVNALRLILATVQLGQSTSSEVGHRALADRQRLVDEYAHPVWELLRDRIPPSRPAPRTFRELIHQAGQPTDDPLLRLVTTMRSAVDIAAEALVEVHGDDAERWVVDRIAELVGDNEDIRESLEDDS